MSLEILTVPVSKICSPTDSLHGLQYQASVKERFRPDILASMRSKQAEIYRIYNILLSCFVSEYINT